MANTPTKRVRAVKQEAFTNINTWGGWWNDAGADVFDEAWGTAEIVVDGDYTLDAADFVSDDARRFVLILTGAGGFVVTVPAVDKPYLVVNRCAADVTVTPFGGVGAVVRSGTAVLWYCDEMDGFVVDPTLDRVKTAAGDINVGNNKITEVADGSPGTKDAANMLRVAELIASAVISLPPQLGHAGKYLTTDGNIPAWGTIAKELPEQSGQSGKVLSTDGVNPAWVASDSGLRHILTQTVTMPVTSIDFTTGITSDYDDYVLIISGFNSSSSGTFSLRTSSDGGASFDGAQHTSVRTTQYQPSGTAPSGGGSSSGVSVELNNAVGPSLAEGGASCVLRFFSVNGGGKKLFTFETVSGGSAGLERAIGAARRESTAVLNALRITGSGNITGGKFSLYGVTKA